MSDKLDKLDYYTLLGLSRDADDAAVRTAFRTFARKYHPDRFATQAPAQRERANAIYRRGSEAYQVLSEASARMVYDQQLDAGELRLRADARERAIRQEAVAAQRREQPITSERAREMFKQAVAASRKKDIQEACRLMRLANAMEPGNPFIEERLAKLEAVVRMRG